MQRTRRKQPKPKRRSAGDRREQILRVAMELIAERGYEATSFQLIADGCGITQTAVLHYFANRERLLEGVLDTVLRHNHGLVEEELSLTDSGLARLRKYFRSTLRWALDFPDESRIILLLYYQATLGDRFSEMYDRIREGAQTRITGYLHAAQRERELPEKMNVPRAATLLHEILLGSVVNAITDRGASRARIEERWEYMLELLRR